MNKQFAIGIPTYNRADLLNEALQKYVVDFPNTKIIVWDNGRQDIFVGSDNIEVYRSDNGNKGFTESVNILLGKIYTDLDIPNAFIPNDDIYWGAHEADVSAMVTRHTNLRDPLVVTQFNWCNFLLPRWSFEEIGRWDSQNFFNYFSDNDYAYRLGLKGLNFVPSKAMNPVVYRESMTIKKDPAINHTSFDLAKRNYIKKWGGMPGSEKFKTPQPTDSNKQP